MNRCITLSLFLAFLQLPMTAAAKAPVEGLLTYSSGCAEGYAFHPSPGTKLCVESTPEVSAKDFASMAWNWSCRSRLIVVEGTFDATTVSATKIKPLGGCGRR